MAFYVDNMTVGQILDLGDDILSSLTEKDMSRALRTVSLAANKRINRLMKYAKKRGGKYVEKVSSPGLDLTSLNTLEGGRFGVGRGESKKTRNEMYKELMRARRFMNAKTSTVKGSIEVRKKKERALFGQTREEITKGMSKKEAKQKIKEITELMPDIYETYDEAIAEYEMSGGYKKETGSMILQDIGRDMLEGIPAEAAKENAKIQADQRYEEAQEQKETAEDFWKSVNGDSEWWENL